MAQKRTMIHPSQEVFLFEGLPTVPASYDLQKAKEASKRRRQRKDHLALNKQTQGFMQKIGGLFIPYSAGENSAIVPSAQTKAVIAMHQAKLRVAQKYENAVDIDQSAVKRWANFSAVSSVFDSRQKYRDYNMDAKAERRSLLDGTNRETREFSRQTIESSDCAVNSLRNYCMHLASFTGATVSEKGKRQWLQAHWTKKVSEAHERAQGYLDKLNEVDFVNFYDEALHSLWSREMHWTGVEAEYKNQQANVRNKEPFLDEIPFGVYLSDPENQPDYF